jgi:hypothetical protein
MSPWNPSLQLNKTNLVDTYELGCSVLCVAHRCGVEIAELEKFEFRNSNFEILLCELRISAVQT